MAAIYKKAICAKYIDSKIESNSRDTKRSSKVNLRNQQLNPQQHQNNGSARKDDNDSEECYFGDDEELELPNIKKLKMDVSQSGSSNYDNISRRTSVDSQNMDNFTRRELKITMRNRKYLDMVSKNLGLFSESALRCAVYNISNENDDLVNLLDSHVTILQHIEGIINLIELS